MKRSGFLVAAAGSAVLTAIPGIARAAEELTLRTPTGDLFGTLELPNAPRPPVVLLIAGSGPTDRDGNNGLLAGRNDALKLLAQALAQRGIASLRYDKRGVAASVAALRGEDGLRVETFVADAVAWGRELQAQGRFSRLAIAGHSEGSLIGMLAAQQLGAAGFASLEGAGHPASSILVAQLAGQFGAEPALRARADEIIASLVAGHEVADVPGTLAILFRPSVQPYLISWFRYDPAKEIAKLGGRVAIVQGTADVQTPRAEGDALHAAAPRARYVVVDGMNHLLKIWPDTSSPAAVLAGYTDPSLPVAPAAVDAVASIAGGT